MDLEHQLETLELVLLEKSGKRLSLIERALIQGACQGQTYEAIAASANYSMGYIKQQVGPKLWQILSEITGKSVSKTSVRLALEQWTASRKESNAIPKTELNGASFQLSTLVEQPQTLQNSIQNTSNCVDWGEAIDVSFFCGRETELATLSQWIEEDRCRLIAILGMGGMGKTALSVKLAHQLQDRFEFVIWR
jgi:ATP-dependent Clp protease ATP-binding subunit ClpA